MRRPPNSPNAAGWSRRHWPGLPEKQRVVVTMRYLLELSEDKTATALGWPKGSVKSRLSRALGRLEADPGIRRLLGREDG